MQALEPVGGIDPEVLGEDGPGAPERAEGLGLPARTIEREHQVPPQPFAQRVFPSQGVEIPDQAGVTPERKLGGELLLDGGQTQLLQARDLTRERGFLG